jgi:hypothetical protein
MPVNLLLSVGWIATLGFLWFHSWRELRQRHARSRTIGLVSARWAICLCLGLFGIWFVRHGSLGEWILGLTLLVAVLAPLKWLIRIGGIQPKWQLKTLRDAGDSLSRRYWPDRLPEVALELRGVVDQMMAIEARELLEIRDLEVAGFIERLGGFYNMGYLGLRAVRIHQIEIELFGPEARKPELTSAEATFRWRLYRIISDMFDCGATPEPQNLARLRELIAELQGYRRDDTRVLVDCLARSANDWLESGAEARWPLDRSGIQAFDESIFDIDMALWPRMSVFWGAELDERDLQDLPSVRTPLSEDARPAAASA